jgi:hypothetical protein
MYSLALASLSFVCLDQSTYALAVSGEGLSRTFRTGNGRFAVVEIADEDEVFLVADGWLIGWSIRFSRTGLHPPNQSTAQAKASPHEFGSCAGNRTG